MQSVRNVLIVGAGMAGMTLGVALKRAGIACEIVEIRPDLTEPGTGISLQGPALRALQSVGVMDRCIERGFGYSHFKTCDAGRQRHRHGRSAASARPGLSGDGRHAAAIRA